MVSLCEYSFTQNSLCRALRADRPQNSLYPLFPKSSLLRPSLPNQQPRLWSTEPRLLDGHFSTSLGRQAFKSPPAHPSTHGPRVPRQQRHVTLKKSNIIAFFICFSSGFSTFNFHKVPHFCVLDSVQAKHELVGQMV